MLIFHRRLPTFEYARPKDEAELFSILSGQARALVFAGGTDIIPRLKKRLIEPPSVLVDLKGLPHMGEITSDRDTLRIGATATIHRVCTSDLVRRSVPILSEAASTIGSIQVRNRGTVVGNVCSAVPSADSAPALLVLDAKLLLKSKGGERSVALDEFFLGPQRTCLRQGEIVKEIQIPLMDGAKGTYIKLTQRARLDLAIVGVAVLLHMTDGRFRFVRIGIGACAPTPIRARRAEELLAGQRPEPRLIDEASRLASEETSPIDDHRASEVYRRLMVEALVRRALTRLIGG
jgi:carbon-monoxide dehydrogenase medium subunit